VISPQVRTPARRRRWSCGSILRRGVLGLEAVFGGESRRSVVIVEGLVDPDDLVDQVGLVELGVSGAGLVDHRLVVVGRRGDLRDATAQPHGESFGLPGVDPAVTGHRSNFFTQKFVAFFGHPAPGGPGATRGATERSRHVRPSRGPRVRPLIDAPSLGQLKAVSTINDT
jgi:hypothetical protein